MQNARVHYLRRVYKIGKFLRRVAKINELALIFLRFPPPHVAIPLAGGDAGFAGEDAGEDGGRGEAALLGDVLHLHVGMVGHQLLGMLDAVAGDELVEIAAVLGIDELAEVGAVERQHLAQVEQAELGIGIGFLALHPLLERSAILGVGAGRGLLGIGHSLVLDRLFCGLLDPGLGAEDDLVVGIDEDKEHQPQLGEQTRRFLRETEIDIGHT